MGKTATALSSTLRHISLGGSLFLALLLCGCQANTLTAWTHERLRHQSFPFKLSESLENPPITLRLNATSPQHATLDFGHALNLKVLDPIYVKGEAHLQWQDIDGDGTLDLLFRAHLCNDPRPLTVAFLYRPTEWERYVLPVH